MEFLVWLLSEILSIHFEINGLDFAMSTITYKKVFYVMVTCNTSLTLVGSVACNCYLRYPYKDIEAVIVNICINVNDVATSSSLISKWIQRSLEILWWS